MLSKKQALQKAADLCVRREQCAFDIRKKLESWQIDSKDSDEIIHRLKQENFIDESRYTEFYVKDKFKLNGWGKIKIRYMLRNKQIPEAVINENTDNISPEAYRQKCRSLIQQKLAKLKEETPVKAKSKIIRFMAGRGFEGELIMQCLDEITDYD
jgi:regulatory protein